MSNSSLKIGSKAPNFSLQDENGKTVKLLYFLRKQPLVLVFYPGDMTPGCTIQMCSLRDEWQKFESAKIAVFGINPASATSHQRFREKCSLPFPLLIDADKRTSEAYEALISIFGLKIIKRSVVGIDKDGIIRYLKRGLPRTADILKAMQAYS